MCEVQVLAVLAQYKELMMLLKKIDTAFSSVSSGKAHHFTGLLSEDVTMIQEALEVPTYALLRTHKIGCSNLSALASGV